MVRVSGFGFVSRFQSCRGFCGGSGQSSMERKKWIASKAGHEILWQKSIGAGTHETQDTQRWRKRSRRSLCSTTLDWHWPVCLGPRCRSAKHAGVVSGVFLHDVRSSAVFS